MESNTVINASPVQQDWEEREFIEVIQLNILQIATFLNEMEMKVKNKLATLNNRLLVIERQIQFVESNVMTTLSTSDNK
jgi:uncharacterized protein